MYLYFLRGQMTDQTTRRLDSGEKRDVREGVLDILHCALNVTIWSSDVSFDVRLLFVEKSNGDEWCRR